MKKNKFLPIIALITFMLTLTGCKNEEGLEGIISIVGSTAIQPLSEKAAEEFMEQHKNIAITVQGGGSGTGINQVLQYNAQIGNSDFAAEEKVEDKNIIKNLVDNKICIQPFSIMVNSNNKVEDLTMDEIAKIYSGDITNWKEVGGSDSEIEIINRPSSSGTRAAFKKTIMGKNSIKDDIGTVQDSSGAILQTVETSENSIAYIGTMYLEKSDKVKGIKIEGYEAKEEYIKDNKYPFWAYGYMITNGEPEGEVKEFLEFIKSKEEIIRSLGYFPV